MVYIATRDKSALTCTQLNMYQAAQLRHGEDLSTTPMTFAAPHIDVDVHFAQPFGGVAALEMDAGSARCLPVRR